MKNDPIYFHVLLINLVYINNTSFIGIFKFLRRQIMITHKYDLPNMINPHRRLKHFPNQSRTSQIRKIMSELLIVMENMLILEYGEKIMEDGLETKDNSFLVD